MSEMGWWSLLFLALGLLAMAATIILWWLLDFKSTFFAFVSGWTLAMSYSLAKRAELI